MGAAAAPTDFAEDQNGPAIPRDEIFNPDEFFVGSAEDERQEQQAEVALIEEEEDDLLRCRLESVGSSAFGLGGDVEDEALWDLVLGPQWQFS